jgi:hypothetical protein
MRFRTPLSFRTEPFGWRAMACLSICLLLLAGACSRARPAAAPAPWLPLAADARLYTDNQSGIQDSLHTVVRDASTLRLFWQQATAEQSTPPPVPEVDFARQMVLLVAAGAMTLEDEIRVDSIRVRREQDASGRAEDVMSVLVRVVEGCGRFSVTAYPVEIVRVRRFDGRVNFIEQKERSAC